MTIFYTADTHFGHENAIRFCNRPFRDAREMNRALNAGADINGFAPATFDEMLENNRTWKKANAPPPKPEQDA